MNKTQFTTKEKFLFKIIDYLNRKGEHTKPENIQVNIENFLRKISEKFTPYIGLDTKGLDIGAGKGTLSQILKPRKVTNLDIYFPKERFEPYIQGKAENLPFEDKSLDFVLAFYSMHHFENQDKALEEINRVLKNKGKFIAMMEFKRFKWQDTFIDMNELSMNEIIYGNKAIEKYSEHHTHQTKYEFQEKNKKLTNLKILKEEIFPPTRTIDRLFKTQKVIYVMEKK